MLLHIRRAGCLDGGGRDDRSGLSWKGIWKSGKLMVFAELSRDKDSVPWISDSEDFCARPIRGRMERFFIMRSPCKNCVYLAPQNLQVSRSLEWIRRWYSRRVLSLRTPLQLSTSHSFWSISSLLIILLSFFLAVPWNWLLCLFNACLLYPT